MDKLPAELAGKAGQVDMDKAEREIKRKEGIICSMTSRSARTPP
jgi:signal recognition particle subunit SRP54